MESRNIVNACMRDSSTALGQAPRRVSVSSGVSVGRRCFLCISSVGAWTALFAALHNETSSHDAAEPRIRSKGKGTHACRVGVSRKFGACADVKCAPSHYTWSVVRLGWLAPARQLECVLLESGWFLFILFSHDISRLVDFFHA